jgi:hypothetical protein
MSYWYLPGGCDFYGSLQNLSKIWDPQGNSYPNKPDSFVSSSQLSLTFNNGNDAGTWTVFVTNPDSQTSNTWSFTVTN